MRCILQAGQVKKALLLSVNKKLAYTQCSGIANHKQLHVNANREMFLISGRHIAAATN